MRVCWDGCGENETNASLAMTKRRFFTFLTGALVGALALAFGLLVAMQTPPLTIEAFQALFRQSCPSGDSVRELTPAHKQQVCDCMSRTATERWPSIASLVAALNQEDRAPRGEADFVPGAARITFRACENKTK